MDPDPHTAPLIQKRKEHYPVSTWLRQYLHHFSRLSEIPLVYDDLRSFTEQRASGSCLAIELERQAHYYCNCSFEMAFRDTTMVIYTAAIIWDLGSSLGTLDQPVWESPRC